MVRDSTTSTPVPVSQLPVSSARRLARALGRLIDSIRVAHYRRQQIGEDMRRARAVDHVDRLAHTGREYI